ncbi:cytochrome P450 [Streptomyces sp. RLB1-33]|uniref:cytochrome P450 n=1 Tax=Streptomyces mirabilis TaxID=68239 RepID=UPI00143E59C3|nr:MULTISPECIES: cytochrome P450 [Streptomyces]QIY74322.1 cytochrome P450 [Streptomyces sp. RLB1-33]QUW78713.1 cytochrome P450 [Streptomyces mirabilis]
MTATADDVVANIPDDPYDDANLTDPYPLYARMRDAGPAVWLEKYQVHAFTRFQQCREILADHETFISGAGVGPRNYHHQPPWRPAGILDSDPPMHTPLRTAMAGVITPRNVRALRTVFQEYAERLVDEILDRGEFDAVTEMAELFPVEVFGNAVGIPREGRAENLLPHGAMNFSAFGPEDARHDEYFAQGEGTVEWVMSNCARERLSPGGLGAKIWEYADEGVITSDEATRLVRALLSAGVDTTVFAIGNTMKCLVASPAEWANLHKNPSLARFAIDEALRHESPFQSFFRTTAREVDFHGVHLPEDTKIALFMGAANRDPRRFGDAADEYRLARDASGHLAFGMGIHQCVGQPISRLEMEVLFTELARRVRAVEPAGEPVPFLHNSLRGWKHLPVRVTAA